MREGREEDGAKVMPLGFVEANLAAARASRANNEEEGKRGKSRELQGPRQAESA